MMTDECLYFVAVFIEDFPCMLSSLLFFPFHYLLNYLCIGVLAPFVLGFKYMLAYKKNNQDS